MVISFVGGSTTPPRHGPDGSASPGGRAAGGRRGGPGPPGCAAATGATAGRPRPRPRTGAEPAALRKAPGRSPAGRRARRGRGHTGAPDRVSAHAGGRSGARSARRSTAAGGGRSRAVAAPGRSPGPPSRTVRAWCLQRGQGADQLSADPFGVRGRNSLRDFLALHPIYPHSIVEYPVRTARGANEVAGEETGLALALTPRAGQADAHAMGWV